MDIVQILLNHNILMTAVSAFVLGTWVYWDRRQDMRNVTLSGMLVAVSLWSFALLMWDRSVYAWQADFWLRSAFAVGSLLPVLFLIFAYALYRRTSAPGWMQALAFSPNAFFLWSLYASQNIVCGVTASGNICFGPAKVLLALHFAVLVIISLALLLMTARRKDHEMDQGRLAAIVVGTIISFDVVFAGLFAAPLAISDNSAYVSNIALLVGMFIMAAAVVRRRLLIDLRLVGVEIFVLVALFVVMTDIVVTDNLLDLSLRLGILLMLVFYGIYTIRNIAREASRLKRIDSMVDQLTKMNGRLLEADRSKTQLVSFASHQLRAPLGGMRSYLDMLSKGDFGKLSDEQKEIIDLNSGVLTQTMETIETFLNVAKSELGELDLYLVETDIRELAERVINTFQPVAHKKGLNIKLNIAYNMEPVISDGGKIYHVFANLIDNAIKYTEEGTISVSAFRQGDLMRIEVSDTGAGLTQAERERLFRVFSRGLAGTRLNSDGSGLGLFLVRKIIQAHGGEVQVSSAGKGQGSTFSFTLPVAPTAG